MKKLFLYIIIALFLLIGCGHGKNINNNSSIYGSAPKMELLEESTYLNYQIDSVIVTDSLDIFDKWHKNTLYSVENNVNIEQRLFLKRVNDTIMINYSTTHMSNSEKYQFKKVKYVVY